jgi:hypothetical protein
VEPTVDEAETYTPFFGSRRGSVAIATPLGVLLVAGATVIGPAVGRSSPTSPAAAPAAITTPPSRSSSSKVTSTPGTDSAAVLPPAQPGKKILPPAMSSEQSDRTRAELNAAAARLPTHMTLTAPTSRAQYAGQTPTYTEDIVSCPHIADRLAADLGARWTYYCAGGVRRCRVRTCLQSGAGP